MSLTVTSNQMQPAQSLLGAVENTIARPWGTIHRAVNYSGDKNQFHTIRKITDLVKKVLEVFQHTLDYCFKETLQYLSFISDLSKTLYVEEVATKGWKIQQGMKKEIVVKNGKTIEEEITIADYRYLEQKNLPDYISSERVIHAKSVATIVMNVTQGILFLGKYVIPTLYKQVTEGFLEACGKVAYSIGGRFLFTFTDVATQIGLKTINRISAIFFMTVSCYQAWVGSKKVLEDKKLEGKEIEKLEKSTSKQLSALEFAGKTVNCTLALFGFMGLPCILFGLCVDFVAVVGQNQGMLSHKKAVDAAAKEQK